MLNPRTGHSDYAFEPISPSDLRALALSLRGNGAEWRRIGLSGRIRVMLDWAEAIASRAREIGDAETIDTGRSRASHEIPHIVAASIREWCARAPSIVAAAERQGISSLTSDVTFQTQLEPYEMLGVISPWNNPFILSTLDAIPALLAGCAVIIKPSEIAPRFIDPVAMSITDVPPLAKVLRYIKGGPESGRALVDEVDALCFTGSVPTGRLIAEACARRFIPSFLELGGKDAAVIMASADLEHATDVVLKGAVYHTGQLCFAVERVYVDSTIYRAFVDRIVEKARSLRFNYPSITSGDLGPFTLRRQADIVEAQLRDAVARGATIECGGESTTLGGGRYMPATVVTGVTQDLRLMRDETFGPVIPIAPFDSEEQAIELANDSDFGLSAVVVAGTPEEAERLGGRLNAGAVSIQDSLLTPLIHGDLEKNSFGLSGLGGSRMGPNGLLRFVRRRALIRRAGPVAAIEDMAEDGAAELVS